jgi:CheY-like chemotaxis protein
VGNLTRLVDDLLDVTRVARGKIELRLQPLDLGELVRRAVDDHRAAFEANGIALTFRGARGELWVEGDPNRLVQVIANLLGNAMKFTNRGGHVEVGLSQQPRSVATLSVRDDGAGIPPDVLPHLFTPFTQAPQTLERSREGLGLGLAVVKGLVELHRGAVDVASAGIGAGSTFTVRLPLKQPPPAQASREGAEQPRQSCRVLLIDDNRDVADSLRDLLQVGGHEAHVAYDGATGLSRAREVQPDVVICDIGLPGMDGYAVARAIRADHALDRTLLVALSGYGFENDVQRARDAGFDSHVIKPPTIDAIRRVIAQAQCG